jgi:hypothetical protein
MPPRLLRLHRTAAAKAEVTLSRPQAEAARCAARVVEVEEELREVLGGLEQHKAASAAKFQQLQSMLQDLSTPFLQLPL